MEQSMGKAKNQKAKQSAVNRLAATRPFIDGFDDYAVEFERWKKMEVVKGILGVFELEDDDYRQKETQALLGQLGFGSCTQLFYNVESDNSVALNEKPTTLGGWTSAVRDHHGHVRPIVFIQKNVPQQPDATEHLSEEGTAVFKLIVLMHELGHAEDIRKSVNYNHQSLEIDIVSAEIYAHEFVLRNCRRLGYRLTFKQYLCSIEDHLLSSNEVVRLSAERFLNSKDLKVLREFTDVSQRVIKTALEKPGRMKEFRKRHLGQ